MAKKEQFLKSRDVAFILDMSPDDVVAEAREGRLKGIKPGGRWIFRLTDVKAYQRKHTNR